MCLFKILVLFTIVFGCALGATYHNGLENRYLKPKHTETYGMCDENKFIGNRILYSSPYPNKYLSETFVFPQVSLINVSIHSRQFQTIKR